MKVLDASFLVKLVLDERGSEVAADLIRGWLLEGEKISTVDLALSESVNVLWKRTFLTGELSESSCLEAAEDLLALIRRMDIHSSSKFIVDALNNALKHGITVYDSLYLALALKTGADLATFDDKLREVAMKVGVRVYPRI